MMDGILLVDKPAGITSYGVVEVVKRRIGMGRVGHGGTLDPMATGVLVILLGKATKLHHRFLQWPKEYEGVLALGTVTSTGDREGVVCEQRPVGPLGEAEIRAVFQQFIGEQDQVPPMMSALKVAGQPLYKLARRGLTIPRAPRRITIYALAPTAITLPQIAFRVVSSSGTYIRTLCEDLGARLGCGGHLAALRRLRSGPFALAEAWPLRAVRDASREDLAARVLPHEPWWTAAPLAGAERA